MMIIDTHCHLTDEAFATDAEACIARALEAGVGKIVLACCDETEVPGILEMCDRHRGILFPTIGIHPENMAADVDAQLARTRQLLDESEVCAIGEIGIDLHWDKSRLTEQLHVLETQFDWAIGRDLPVLLHVRDAMPEFLAFLHIYINKVGRCPRGILHCYSGTAEEAREAFTLGQWLIGVGGTLTYKKSRVGETVQAVGRDRIVLETDAPYLAPVPHRGKRNEPAYTADTARFLANLTGCDLETIAQITTRNAERLLGI